MSKKVHQYYEAVEPTSIQSSTPQDLNVTEHCEASAHAGDAVSDKVERFATSCGLTQHLDVFRKAASVAQGEVPLEDIGLSAIELQALRDETNRKWRQPKMLYFTVLVCSIGAIEQGWAQTGMNGANLYFPKALGIGSNSKHDNFLVGLINSGIYLSTGLLGAWLSDPINNKLGRLGAVFSGGLLCLISNLGSSISRSWQQLLIWRVLLGVGLGVNASTVSVFAAECAPPNIRGGLAVSWQVVFSSKGCIGKIRCFFAEKEPDFFICRLGASGHTETGSDLSVGKCGQPSEYS